MASVINNAQLSESKIEETINGEYGSLERFLDLNIDLARREAADSEIKDEIEEKKGKTGEVLSEDAICWISVGASFVYCVCYAIYSFIIVMCLKKSLSNHLQNNNNNPDEADRREKKLRNKAIMYYVLLAIPGIPLIIISVILCFPALIFQCLRYFLNAKIRDDPAPHANAERAENALGLVNAVGGANATGNPTQPSGNPAMLKKLKTITHVTRSDIDSYVPDFRSPWYRFYDYMDPSKSFNQKFRATELVKRTDIQHTSDTTCAICIFGFSSIQQVYLLPCGHYYHFDCLEKFKNYSLTGSFKCMLCQLNTLNHFLFYKDHGLDPKTTSFVR
ncbi:hypothetical protein WICMUC_005062 [Wickerhamomyces mucosus]|uniref:RING-type domain-containing protein n=1 Tax=Wickerhamomyces mucosus TaxID=1378264 RepID=A0A9P8PB99_9ASCO|nr:hypothetical protein WICMUC_005062 [Wickerhamomyces mucosus]